MTTIRRDLASPQHAGHQKMIRRGPDGPDTRPGRPDRPGIGIDDFKRGPEDFAPKPPRKPGPPVRIDKDSKVTPPGPADRQPVPGKSRDDDGGLGPIHEPAWNRYPRKGVSEGASLLDRTPGPLGEKQVRSPLAPVNDVLEATQELLAPVVESVLAPIRWVGDQLWRTVEYTQEHPEILLTGAVRAALKGGMA